VVAPDPVEVFLEHLPAERRAAFARAPGLAAALEQARLAGQRAWPEVPLPAAEFAAHLAARLPDGPDPRAVLERLFVADLHLACAALRGDPRGVRALRDAHQGALRADLLRTGLDESEADDLMQRVFDKLLVKSPERPARIAQYAGQGPLRAWLRVVARREALNQRARDRREVAWAQEDLEQLLGALAQADPELDQCKREFQREFKAAFEEAFAALATRERNLLRHVVFDRLSLEQIGRLYRVHQSTVSRWMARLQQTLLRRTLKALGARLRIERGEAASIVRQFQSQLEVSMRRLLDAPRPAPETDPGP
jgi:RNA polymerase sigma-70 factor (ECF subfamily)